jgi:hypothetical protein
MLRIFAQDIRTLKHDIYQKWYDGISELHQRAEETTDKCPKALRIDNWDAIFLLQHSQYLLTRIDSSYSLRDKLFERAAFIAMAALLTYNKSWEAVKAYKQIVRKNRGAGPWHNAFVEFEQMVFIASEQDIQLGIVSISDAADLAHRTTIELIDVLDKELRLPPRGSIASIGKLVKRKMSTIYGVVSKRTMSAGQYETHDYYFLYGILHLLYSLSSRIKAETRVLCFAEMVGGIRRVLEKINDIPLDVHRKATDLYNYIVLMGVRDGTSYGKPEDVAMVTTWIRQHPDKAEEEEHSKS